MNVLYCRVSTIDQKTDRQKINEKDYNKVIEDKCSGSIPFFDREGGKEIQKLIEHGIIKNLFVYQIDRLGRDLIFGAQNELCRKKNEHHHRP